MPNYVNIGFIAAYVSSITSSFLGWPALPALVVSLLIGGLAAAGAYKSTRH